MEECSGKGTTAWLQQNRVTGLEYLHLWPSKQRLAITRSDARLPPCCSAFGTVYEVEDLRNGELFAVKQISKAKLACTEDVEDVRREMQVQCVCRAWSCQLAVRHKA